ncbi:MAG: hypothetical protein A3I68_07570 [Candidatus Melainabacteria bacterium RIFCSPLOWO2_02_FULL_35_15]|nr:MAG: hypothetical protein A3F80_02955 [Candidatus Melainabacteria bacterium RIFCSPLOWO2_12_FULL_35_11]OGI14154.1 MAG: hypothetical protein A3I68_07570 [Candidatus Melainabacteria bacterium RIFCSPLOWO2_02_FULL_35_15]
MTPISATNPNTQSRWNRFLSLAKNYAKIIDSRESTYRLALDLSAFDIPVLAAAAFRNFWNFMEAFWEAGIGTVMIFLAPRITSFIGKLAGKSILSKEEQKDAVNYLRFQMSELTNETQLEKGLRRILEEEPSDQRRISELYKNMENKEKQAEYHSLQADEITDFCKRCKLSEAQRDKIYRLKKAVILGESLIEGGVWGSFGLSLRFFRKYILQKGRFTGTMGYLSDSDSSKIGEGGELNWFQKIGGVSSILLSPVLNTIFLNKTKDKNKVQNNRFLSLIDSQLDMTHGVYPKLGLLFTYTSVPKWLGVFITTQGWYERVERIFKFFTILPSWWLGHRITNGILAKNADKYLANKYKVKEGILVSEECIRPKDIVTKDFWENLKYLCPEPARIHQVLNRVDKDSKDMDEKTKEQFHKEAEDLHTKTLYKGFALHSLLVWCAIMLVNWTTKLRVKSALGE